MTQKSQLSPQRRRLVELMQQINFGRIDRLEIHRGQPMLESPMTIIREYKFGGENGTRSERMREDFCLKRQVSDLMSQFDLIQNGMIDQLEVKHGLPFRMVVTEVTV